jgi:hypothetical protein
MKSVLLGITLLATATGALAPRSCALTNRLFANALPNVRGLMRICRIVISSRNYHAAAGRLAKLAR